MGGKILGLAPFGVLCVLSWELHAQAGLADRCPQPIARIVSAQGTIELKEASANVWRLAKIDALVCPGDSIHVGERSRGAILLLAAETVLRIDENTTLQVLEPRQDYRSLLDLLNGVVHFLSRAPRSLEVKTPFVNAAVEGTEFLIRVETNHTFISVFEGRVAARNDSGSLSLTSNQSALIRAGEAPELRIVVRPRDAVRWALYYQPVLAGLFDPTSIDPRQDLTPALREVLRILGRGDLKAAFDRLDRIPEPERGERFYVYRAALLLSVGRVDEARSDLDRALALAPESGEVYALRAVIAIAGNDRQQALSDGREAVARSPRSSAARIALSYALQANFELAAARDTLLQAVEQRPEDSLAWARLAELWLSLGYLDKALEAAGRAASLAPNLGRTNTVLGFAALAQIKLSTAKAAFEKAVGVESENPLPRLGLGLAKIREGALREGRLEIEIAAGVVRRGARHRPGVALHGHAERLGQRRRGDVVVGRADAAGGEHVVVGGAQLVDGGGDCRLVVGHHAHLAQPHADVLEPPGDIRNVGVARAPREDLVADDDQRGGDGARHGALRPRFRRPCRRGAASARPTRASRGRCRSRRRIHP